jgi:hypothetical protein
MAHTTPPAAFQKRNRHQFMRVIPAIHAPVTRTPPKKRARNTALPPWRSKNRSAGGMTRSAKRFRNAYR